jgi:hypothetical protein
MRPGLHLSNCSPITVADEDIVKRWAPLSALLAMNNIVEDDAELPKLVRLWETAGRPLLILRKYFEPEWGPKAGKWDVHAMESVIMARRCMALGVPAGKIALKPFNEPNMPTWAQYEGFGDEPEHIDRYGRALNTFIDVAKNEEPEVLIGGPHLTVGNHDVRFPNDPQGRYYYGPNSLCQDALERLDLHFVHCYGFRRGQYKDRAHGLRFLEYEKYFSGKPIYIVEGCYGIQWENGNAIDPAHNNVRGEDTVAYLRLLDQYPQVKGITLWIGGWTGWQEHRHSDGADPGTHRPVVFYVEDYVKDEQPGPEPDPDPEPEPDPDPDPEPVEVTMKAYRKDGSEVSPQELLDAYAVSIEPCEGTGFRVVEIRERCESNNCDVFVKGVGGELLINHEVRWGWDGEEVIQQTGPDGRVGFAMSRDAYYHPTEGRGPHWAAIEGSSERVTGIGMIVSTVHCTLSYVFQYLEGDVEPDPGPDPEPPADDYKLRKRLEQAPHGFEDLRAQIEEFSDMETLEAEARRDENGNPLFHLTELIMVHHSGNAIQHTALSTARQAVKEGEPTIEYHFCIGMGEEDGLLSWTSRLVWKTNHTYGMNRRSVAVCILGDYSEKKPSKKQLETTRFVIAALYEFFGQGWGKFRLVGLVPHRYVVDNETECPGKAWPEVLWSGPWPELRGSV